jgi:lactoylglutathione lyase
MMVGSVKITDLRRDPRLALHSPTTTALNADLSDWPGEEKIARFGVEGAEAGSDSERLIDFRIDVAEVVLTSLGRADLEQKYRWPEGPTEPIEFAELVPDGRELWFTLPDDPWHGLRPGASGKPVSHVLCLKTDDVDSAVSRLRDSGTPVLYEPTDQPCYGERMAYVANPDGRPIMLYSDINVDVSASPIRCQVSQAHIRVYP